MGKSQELYEKAKKIIPGATQLLSKRSERFLPEQWPAYYDKSKGCEVWDLDGKKYVDMSLMGVGACILGYADDDVDNAVKSAIDKGSMNTLNAPEEVELAELLLKLHPKAGMVRYARTGGEAMTVAVRIARSYTRKDKIAFCGYHGWHDWYLAANLADDSNLDGHHIPGLEPRGVPRSLKGTAIPFYYNKIEELESIVEKEDIGAIVMEPIRHHPPKDGFLKKVRKIASEKGIVLVYDEITSGWRMNVGGIHKLYGVYPDIAVYGKAMSNGFPMAAIVGKSEVMDSSQESFISSTYWTERIGPTAAIATINKLIDKKVPEHLCKIGNLVGEGWEKISKEQGIDMDIEDGMPPLMTYSLKYEDARALRTLFTQEMLKRGFLASSGVYASYSHNEQYVERYLANANEVFALMKKAMDGNKVKDMLKGPEAYDGFKRLN